jgi:hypothetical protein
MCHLILLVLSYLNHSIIIISIILFCGNTRLCLRSVNSNSVKFVSKFYTISIISLQSPFITDHVEEIKSQLQPNDKIIIDGALRQPM